VRCHSLCGGLSRKRKERKKPVRSVLPVAITRPGYIWIWIQSLWLGLAMVSFSHYPHSRVYLLTLTRPRYNLEFPPTDYIHTASCENTRRVARIPSVSTASNIDDVMFSSRRCFSRVLQSRVRLETNNPVTHLCFQVWELRLSYPRLE
jgi:hypothetical protein